MIRITTLHGHQIATVLHDLASLRIRVFREYPYLYEGSLAYEKQYLQTYLDCSQSIAVLAWDGDELIGASTGLPMSAEVEEFQRPFLNRGLSPETIFYCAESVLLPDYRGQGIYKAFFRAREAHAVDLGATETVFCAVVRPDDHPLKPVDYVSLDHVWAHFGYAPVAGLITEFSWQDIDGAAETLKPMQFYRKTL